MITKLSGASDASLAISIGRWQEQALAEAYRRHGGIVFGLAGGSFSTTRWPRR